MIKRLLLGCACVAALQGPAHAQQVQFGAGGQVLTTSGQVTFASGGGGSYPASVVTQGLQTTYDLRLSGHTGPRSPSTCDPVACALSLPGLHASVSGDLITITGSGTWNQWNLGANSTVTTGYAILFNCSSPCTVTFNDPFFAWNASDQSYWFDAHASAAAVTINVNYCNADGTNSTPNNGGARIGANITDTWDHCTFNNFANDFVIATDGADTFTNDYFQCVGQNTGNVSAHTEVVHHASNTKVYTNDYFNTHCTLVGNAHATGQTFDNGTTFFGGSVALNVTFNHDIFNSASTMGSNVVMQAAGDPPGTSLSDTLTVENSVLQPGLSGNGDGQSGYVCDTTQTGNVHPTIVLSNNTDYIGNTTLSTTHC